MELVCFFYKIPVVSYKAKRKNPEHNDSEDSEVTHSTEPTTSGYGKFDFTRGIFLLSWLVESSCGYHVRKFLEI